MNQQTSKVQVVTTKVTADTKEKLNRLAARFGISRYQLFQLFALVCVRLWDAPSSLTDEHRVMLEEFLHTLAATQGESFNPLTILTRQQHQVASAILFVRTPAAGEPQLLAISPDGKGGWREDYNLDTMLTHFLASADPRLLRTLQAEMKNRQQISLFGTLREIVQQQQSSAEEVMQADIAELFSDICTRFGERPAEDVFYKRKLNSGDYTTHTQPRKKHVRA